jgi:hypothetical protein
MQSNLLWPDIVSRCMHLYASSLLFNPLVTVSFCCFLSFLAETIKQFFFFFLFLYMTGLNFRGEYIKLKTNGLPS